jgi:predicted dehydrogenase/nucleoside-diphosphate-sugar epimerase
MNRSKPQVVAQRDTLRIGIIGAGQMARQHAQAIGRLGNATVTAVVDPDPSALEAIRRIQPGAVGFASVEDLLGSEAVDVVHICTPPQTHELLTEQVLDAGCHVYVEKPFVETQAAATRLAKLADRKGLKICAGHQLLYEPPTLRALELLPALGELTHVESYFSFRAMKHSPSGRAPLRDDLQLLDVLPHPVYLLLDFLERAAEGTTRLVSVDIGPRGTVHALVRRGSLTATLVVTLEGRPVENYLRLVGVNGSIHADYVRSTVQRNLGPGASGIDKLLSPYRLAWQLLTGTTAAMGKRFLKRQRSYPGLAEIFGAFYESIRQNRSSPVTRANLIETVAICEQIADALRAAYPAMPTSVSRVRGAPVVVTGGTGFLGREVARALFTSCEQVRVVARRTPPEWEKIPGVTYIAADISRPIAAEVMAGAQAIIHCAAETAGGWDQHQKNSVRATEEVLQAAASANVKRVIHISSISTLAVPTRGGQLTDDGALETNSRSGGPYAWGKIESERLAVSRCKDLGIDLRVVRPSALVDYRHFDPPGLLGKRIGNIFVAVGVPGHKLGVVDVVFSAQTLAWMVRHFEEAPLVLNLFEPELPTKRELLVRLRRGNPDLTVVWLPPVILLPLSWFAIAIQKVLRPRSPALNVAKIFARLRYDTSRIAGLAPAIRADALRTQSSEPEPTLAAAREPEVFGVLTSPARQLA